MAVGVGRCDGRLGVRWQQDPGRSLSREALASRREIVSLTTLRLGKNTRMMTSADPVQSRATTREWSRLRGVEALCQSPLAFYPLRNRNQSSTDPLNISSPSTSQLCPVVSLAFNLQGFLTLHTHADRKSIFRHYIQNTF